MSEPITKKELTTLLTQDSYYRKLQEWPLINLNKFKKISRKIDDVLSMQGFNTTNGINKFERFKKNINEGFPYTIELLIKFKDHLVACGGAIVKAIHKLYGSGDIDLFFYNLDTNEANKMRIEAVEFIINSYENNKFTNDIINYYITRNEYVTTLYVTKRDINDNNISFCDDIYKYQFIHRIYPNMSSIIGGFDLSVCMIAFDGDNIYGTPLGAWSNKHASIIIDTKRRSTSFEYRLKKYQNSGFKLIFPGLPISLITNFIETEKNNHTNMMNEIYNTINKYGYETEFKIEEAIHKPSGKFQLTDDLLPYFKLHNYYDPNYILNKPKSDFNLSLVQGLRTKFFDHNKIEDRFIDKISDYDYPYTHPICLQRINAQQLRSDKLNLVCSVIKTSDASNLHKILIDDIDNPNLMFDHVMIEYYNIRTASVRSLSILTDPQEINTNFYKLSKYFGKLTPDVVKIQHTDEYYKYRDVMIEKMKVNADICKENLKGIKWITQNSGRQWTSSINPIIADPREWYGKHYISVLSGIPGEIETCLRLMRLERTESVWITINDDIFNFICMHLLKKYADEAWNYI